MIQLVNIQKKVIKSSNASSIASNNLYKMSCLTLSNMNVNVPMKTAPLQIQSPGAFDNPSDPSSSPSPSFCNYTFTEADLNHVLYGYIQTFCNGLLLRHAVSDVKISKSYFTVKILSLEFCLAHKYNVICGRQATWLHCLNMCRAVVGIQGQFWGSVEFIRSCLFLFLFNIFHRIQCMIVVRQMHFDLIEFLKQLEDLHTLSIKYVNISVWMIAVTSFLFSHYIVYFHCPYLYIPILHT